LSILKKATSPSQPHDAVIRVYDAAGNVIETHLQKDASTSLTRFE
jgi:hypothetical protein